MSALQTITKITEGLLSNPSLSKWISEHVRVDITAELLFDQNADLSVCGD